MDSRTRGRVKIMQNHGRVSRNQGLAHSEKVRFRVQFKVILGAILEALGCQSQIFSDSVGTSFLGQQNYDFGGQKGL